MADATPTPLPEVPADLSNLSDDELRGLYAEVTAARDGILNEGREAPGLQAMRLAREQAEALKGQLAQIVTEVSGRMDERAGFDADALDTPGLPDDALADTAGDAAAAESDEAKKVSPEAPAPVAETAPAAGDMAPVTASAALSAEDIIANRPGGGKTPSPTIQPATRSGVQVPMVASAGERESLGSGGDFDFEKFGYMLDEAKNGGEGKFQIAKIAGFEATQGLEVELLTKDMGVAQSDRLIRESIEAFKTRNPKLYPEFGSGARTAAICDPLDIIREIPDCTQATEPFSDSLPQRPAGRLGFQYTPSMSFSAISSGVGTWSEAQQAAVVPTDPATWKPCVAVTCPTPVPVRAEAIAACFYFDITTDMSNPERIQDAMKKIAAYKARIKTARLLQIAETFSQLYSWTGPYGALPGFIQAVLEILAQAQYPERLDNTPYNLYMPPGLMEALVIDRANRAYSNSDAESRDITGYIEEQCAAGGHNVQVIDLADVTAGFSAPFPGLVPIDGHLYPLPSLGGTASPFRVHLIAPESALYFSTGEVNTGIERSPDLMRRNQAQWFMEEFVGLAKPGCHPWFRIDLTLCDSGARAALTTPFSCPGAPS